MKNSLIFLTLCAIVSLVVNDVVAQQQRSGRRIEADRLPVKQGEIRPMNKPNEAQMARAAGFSSVEEYREWRKKRAEELAKRGNKSSKN